MLQSQSPDADMESHQPTSSPAVDVVHHNIGQKVVLVDQDMQQEGSISPALSSRHVDSSQQETMPAHNRSIDIKLMQCHQAVHNPFTLHA